jgi:cation transport regulator ChaB
MFTNLTELPPSTRNLPYHGKRIFMKFFNRALKKYNSDKEATKVAWQAVKRKYYKHNDQWLSRPDANDEDTTTTSSDSYSSDNN